MEPEYERNRPVAVMLNNLKKAQPQLGNAQADIIYEVPAEGGITRMLAALPDLGRSRDPWQHPLLPSLLHRTGPGP